MWQTKKSETLSKATIGGESIRQVTSGYQSRFIQAVVCAASVVMCATSARAQQSSTDVSRTQENTQDLQVQGTDPCNGVAVSFQVHAFSQMVDRSTKTTFDFTFRTHENGQGTGSDAAQYQFEHLDEFRIRSNTSNFTFTTAVIREHIIRQGPPVAPGTKDDWFTLTSDTVSPNLPWVFKIRLESTCK